MVFSRIGILEMAGIDDVLESFSFTISAQERCSRDSVILLTSGTTSVLFPQRRQIALFW